ncbi:MAG: M16 family metallopeptidase [bacterium JZ-2024 1]
MRKRIFISRFLCFLGIFVSASGDWKKIPIPSLPEYSPPAVKTLRLSNGIPVFYLKDPRFPVVYVEILLRGGVNAEPVEYPGMSSLLAEVVRSGGSLSFPSEVLDETLDRLGASLSVRSDPDAFVFTLRTLKSHFPSTAEILADVLLHPAFPEDKLELTRRQMKSQLARRKDFPTSFATEDFRQLIYGLNHPLARIPTEENLDSITSVLLKEIYPAWISSNSLSLGIWGDIDEEAFLPLFERLLGSIPYRLSFRVSVPPFSSSPPGIYFRENTKVNQSNIRIGGIGITRDNPFYPGITVWNEILSGAQSSRLFSIIRSQMGLAYSVGGGVGSAFAYPGLLLISAGTKSESTVIAIQSILKVVSSLREGDFSDEEVQQAKESILNSLIFEEDTPAELVRRAMSLDFYGYPADFYQQFARKISALKKEDVVTAAKMLVRPENFVIYVLGNSRDFDAPLSSLGQLTSLEPVFSE